VHSLTALNGREQPVLPSLALSSPRVTVTQEGLATFAEQITGSIDIERMKRISLRIEAVAMALDGANFLEVFHYFRLAGQSDTDSFTSAQRVFRGVPTGGGLSAGVGAACTIGVPTSGAATLAPRAGTVFIATLTGSAPGRAR